MQISKYGQNASAKTKFETAINTKPRHFNMKKVKKWYYTWCNGTFKIAYKSFESKIFSLPLTKLDQPDQSNHSNQSSQWEHLSNFYECISPKSDKSGTEINLLTPNTLKIINSTCTRKSRQ